jgi:hypothetical protein
MAEHLFDRLQIDRILATVNAQPPPRSVTSFLGQLNLLYGVPFAYLVADEKLLPPESLKFFSIDPQWINALLGGALSTGRIADVRFLLNKAGAGNYGADILREARAARAQKRGDPRPGSSNASDITSTDHFTGFLLRSQILQAWPGLEVKAYLTAGAGASETRRELAVLRLDRVAPDILLGLVDGELTELRITQPPEGLHFEAKDAPFRGDAAKRVLDIVSWLGGDTAHGSAGFAERRTSHPLRFIFKIGT